jgi:hypothetical protein
MMQIAGRRQSFQNLCRVYGVTFRVENVGIAGAYWDCERVV